MALTKYNVLYIVAIVIALIASAIMYIELYFFGGITRYYPLANTNHSTSFKPEHFDLLKVGMQRDEVVKLIGQPLFYYVGADEIASIYPKYPVGEKKSIHIDTNSIQQWIEPYPLLSYTAQYTNEASRGKAFYTSYIYVVHYDSKNLVESDTCIRWED